MTYDYGTTSPGTGASSGGSWPADDQPTTQLPSVASSGDTGSSGAGETAAVAKDEAMGVASSAKEKGSDLVGEGVDQAKSVAGEATRQARDLMGEARVELAAQAYEQQQRLAGGLRSFGQELGSMADSSTEGGLASDVARQVASRTSDLAQWFEDREPGSVLEEVKEFARRRPGAFLAIAAGAGVLAGRLTRGLKDADEPGGGTTSGSAGRTSPSHRAAGAPERVTAWPPTGVEQQGAGYGQGAGYAAGYGSGVTDLGTTAYETAPAATGGSLGATGYDEAGYDEAGYDQTGYGQAGYGTGADETADPLDAPLRPDRATDPTVDPAAQPRNEEGWR